MEKKIYNFSQMNQDFTILYVEDDDSVRNQTVKLLNNYFQNIITSHDGEGGLNLYREHKINDKLHDINLVVTDIKLGKLDGLNMISKIKEIEKDIPVIILSGFSKEEYFLDAIKFGVDDFLLKPYSLQQLNESIYKIIKKYHENDIVKLVDNIFLCGKCFTLKEDGIEIQLTKNEKLLISLFINENKLILSSEKIEHYLYEDFKHSNKRVRNLISRLNAKLNAKIIVSVYSEGYKLI